MDPTISLSVTYRGTTYPVSIASDSPLESLHTTLEELTSVPSSLQKLLYKSKNSKLSSDGEITIAQAGLKDGMKIQMLGTTTEELGSLKATEAQEQKRDRILRERALKAPTKVRSTASGNSSTLSFRFHQLAPLPHLPNPPAALALLTRLSEDPAIRHVMQAHQFSVGLLTELAPHEHPDKLGLNVNHGEAIKLRIRTNAYDGFRNYNEIRRVLCHELAHNVFSEHGEDFKTLNSTLNREVAEYERSVVRGTNRLVERGDVHDPVEAEAEAHVHVLGGMMNLSSSSSSESPEERRRRILDATIARLKKEDEEIDNSCGTG